MLPVVKKLILGIVEFRRNVQQGYREAFGRLATGQSPDTLFIACSDSRVVPNTFASTNPGDLFVMRNIGNLIPPCGSDGHSVQDESEAAAIEFSVLHLDIAHIIVCGHSECAAMRALVADRQQLKGPHLRQWLRHGDPALESFTGGLTLDATLSPHNQLSQVNVLQQMAHIQTYPVVRQRMAEGRLAVHGLWFDIARADVYAYEPEPHRFVLIDDAEAERLLARIA